MKSQMTEEQILELSEEVKQQWWDKNKEAFLRRIKNGGLVKLPADIESEDVEFVRACRARLAQQLQKEDIVAEDLLTGMSPKYLAGIREAREDYHQ